MMMKRKWVFVLYLRCCQIFIWFCCHVSKTCVIFTQCALISCTQKKDLKDCYAFTEAIGREIGYPPFDIGKHTHTHFVRVLEVKPFHA